MSMHKPSVRSVGLIATLMAGAFVFATIDDVDAKGSGGSRSGGFKGSAYQPHIVNTIHPIIYKPGKSDRDHDRKSDRHHDRKKADRDRDHCRKSGKCYVGIPVTKPVGKLPPQPTPGGTTTTGNNPGGTTTTAGGPGGTTTKPGGTQPPGLTDPGYSAPPNLSGAGGNPNKSPGGPPLKQD